MLFEHALHLTGGNWFAYNNLGNVLLDEENDKAAVSHYNEALRIRQFFGGALAFG